MKAISALTAFAWLLAAPAFAQHWHDDRERWEKHAKHHEDDADRELDRKLEGCFFQPADVTVISESYSARGRSLPPGLKKKFYRTGHLPPGWEQRMEPVPVDVERQLVTIPKEYRRGIIDGSIVLYVPKTGAILDAVVLFPPRLSAVP